MARKEPPKYKAIRKSDCVSLLAIAERVSWGLGVSPGEATDALAAVLTSSDYPPGLPRVFDCSGDGLAKVVSDKKRAEILDALISRRWWEEIDLPELRATYPYRIQRADLEGVLVTTANSFEAVSEHDAWTRFARIITINRKDFDQSLSPAQWDELHPPQSEALRRAIEEAQSHLAAARQKIEGDAQKGGPAATPLPSADYLDPLHPRYSVKLAAAVRAWLAVEEVGGKHPRQALEAWLEKNAAELRLTTGGKPNRQGIQECAKVANWKPTGGAPKTPSRK